MSLENPGDLSKLDLNTLDSLLSVLNTSGTQNSNNALYQTIAGLIKRTKEIQSALAAALTQLKTEVDGGKLPNKAGGLLGASYLTKNDDHIILPNARKAVAGPGINIDYGTAHEAIISGVAGGTPVIFPEDGGSDSILIPGPAGTTGAIGPTGPAGPAGSSASGGGVPPFGLVDEYGGDEFPLIPGPQGNPASTGTPGLVELAQIITSGSQATVDFTNIPSGYSSLLIIFSSQDTAAGTSGSSVYLKVNNDGTSGNYDSSARVGSQNSLIGGLTLQAPTSAGMYCYDHPNAGNTNLATNGQLVIPNYDKTSYHKEYIANWHSTWSGLIQNYQTSGRWKAVTAINRLTLSGGTAFTDGCVFTLFGYTGPNGSTIFQGARQEGRLTLVSGNPVPTTDQTGKTTFYWTPCDASMQSITTGGITLWNGSSLVDVGITELSKALGTLTSGKNYNVYIDYNAGTPQLIIGAAWTNDTTMSETLAAQYDSVRKATIVVLSGTSAYRFVGAFRTTSTTTTEDSIGGSSSQVGGKRFLANAYNLTLRNLGVIDTTDAWAYTTNTIRQANGASGNKVEFLLAIANLLVEGQVIGNIAVNGNSSKAAKVGIGLDATTTFSGLAGAAQNVGTSQAIMNIIGLYSNYPGLGYHYLSWNEKGADGTTSLFLGDDGGDSSQSGLTSRIWN